MNFLSHPRHLGGVKGIAKVVDEADLHFMGADGSQRKTRGGLAEGAGGGLFDRPVFRTGARDDEIEVADFQVFEIVVVARDIGLDLVLLQEGKDVFNDFRLVAVSQSRGIDGMMTEDEFPLGLRVGEGAVEPLELEIGILRGNFAELGVVLVLLDEGARVDVEAFKAGCGIDRINLGVVTGGHDPARVGFAVFELRSGFAGVVVVAEDDVPGDLEGGGVIDRFKGSLPVVVVERGDAPLIKIIADGNDEGSGGIFTGDGHLLGDLFLVRPALPAPIPDDGEVERAGGKIVRVKWGGHEPANERRLRSGKKSADKIAAGQRHGWRLAGLVRGRQKRFCVGRVTFRAVFSVVGGGRE